MGADKLQLAIEISISIIGIWFLWFYFWKNYAVDKFKFDIGCLKRELDSLSVDPASGFNKTSKVFQSFDSIFGNSYFSTANYIITWPKLSYVVIKYALDRMRNIHNIESSKEEELIKHINAVSDKNTKENLYKLKEGYELAVISYMVKVSAVLLLVTIFIVAYHTIKNLLINMCKRGDKSNDGQIRSLVEKLLFAYNETLGKLRDIENRTGFRFAL